MVEYNYNKKSGVYIMFNYDTIIIIISALRKKKPTIEKNTPTINAPATAKKRS